MALRPPRTNVLPFTTDDGLNKRFDVVCAGHGTIANHVVKVGAEEEARWHRDADRRAVATLPRTDVRHHDHEGRSAGYSISCACGWHKRDGETTTRYDTDRHERDHAAALNIAVA